MAKWIRFLDAGRSASGKTRVWLVAEKNNGPALGRVEWFARWRRYAFAPFPDTVYEQDCLRDIAEFCEYETKMHKQRREEMNCA